jgi:hypothetical protein
MGTKGLYPGVKAGKRVTKPLGEIVVLNKLVDDLTESTSTQEAVRESVLN